MNKMKHIKRLLGIACFCISLIFGAYVLAFQDVPQSSISQDITISAVDCLTAIV